MAKRGSIESSDAGQKRRLSLPSISFAAFPFCVAIGAGDDRWSRGDGAEPDRRTSSMHGHDRERSSASPAARPTSSLRGRNW